MPVRIGIGLPNQVRDVSPAVIPAWAQAAEDAGFASLATVGRYAYPGVSETVALAAAAAVTRRAELISAVLLAATWPAPLLAKELAGIDGISGGRLTVGIGAGQRPDDFAAAGQPMAGRGARLDRDVRAWRDIWNGAPAAGGASPAVPAGTRLIPLLFGGFTPAAMSRMARCGEGYIAAALPPAAAAPALDAARQAWQQAGRPGAPRLVALAYFGLGDPGRGRAGVHDYYAAAPDVAAAIAGALCDSPAKVADTVAAFADLGVDDLVFNTGTADIDEVSRLAAAVF